MTNDELQSHIRAIELALERGEIEASFIGSDSDYTQVEQLNIPLPGSVQRLRIKPKPLECWVNVYPPEYAGGDVSNRYATEESAKRHAMPSAVRVAVHMREVVDD